MVLIHFMRVLFLAINQLSFVVLISSWQVPAFGAVCHLRLTSVITFGFNFVRLSYTYCRNVLY